jgi:MarR family transcriptional regulator, organic hydroperoxide resistance regulator
MESTVDWKKISGFSGPEQSPGFLLWQISTQWRRRIENALSTVGLTHPQFVLLASVGWLSRKGNAASQVELARHCKMDINMTSQILRTLEKRGYIERSQRKGDDRSKFPRVTWSGGKLIEKALPLVESVDQEFFGKLQEDIGTCVALLQRLGRVVS